MTTTKKQPKEKPPIVTSKVPGGLNPVESAIDSKRVIKEWCIREGHTRGYGVAPMYWEHIFHALYLMQKRGDYPDKHALSKAIEELLRPFEYSEEDWATRGEMRLDPRTGVYIAVNPYPKRVYSPVGDKRDNLVDDDREEQEA